eukprot:CAMPEP_0176353374 /NCGR_PEP_ID=MMETSP0126-20121128/11732_1 /TAXON_ID=141414 ORGANISM="Strombidinopsis acuminatum, Strain SPMC142" /NCGR_SAMPLE_ID=MMETSP0126 /ASSEMBLY_ACC=CAM_ASM_000229 /LENGTH=76 /DNA_ID=CAMNT_0017704963 /DNA_START=994 /DNA_END=1224 /DNA_ORIENTATION=-
MEKLSSSGTDKKSIEAEKAVLLNDMCNYKREITAKENEITHLKQSLVSLDANLDELQGDLDQKTQELSQYKMKFEQ